MFNAFTVFAETIAIGAILEAAVVVAALVDTTFVTVAFKVEICALAKSIAA